jgi:heme-degrading monooxygenase HmoA
MRERRQQQEKAMFIAMNRFRVTPGREEEFEAIWRKRQSLIAREPGFIEFDMLRGPRRDDHSLYASHTVWASRAHFEAWTRSESFRAAHANTGGAKGLYLGHPDFEGFETLSDMHLTAEHEVA